MKKKIFSLILCLPMLPLLISCFSGGKEAKNSKNAQRLEIAKEGIVIDAKYDPRLDNLVPGFKILSVGLTNNGVDILRLNPLSDKWEIVDATGKNRRAVNSMRIKNPALYGQLPAKMQQLLEYPVGISVGYSETIDLFFPSDLDLNAFRSISYFSGERKQSFDVLAGMENSSQVPVNPSEPAQAPEPTTVGRKGKHLKQK